ncbi:MAG: hypothetical protein AAGI49_07920 [Bacteroidota bacterium]
MKQKLLILCYFCAFLLCSCEEDSASGSEAYPDTPEAVVRIYQAHLDKNEFEQVKMYSTAKEQARIDEIAPIILEEVSDSTIFTTTFIRIDCKKAQRQAICDCVIENFDEQYEDTFVLALENGQWKVDAAEEEIDYDHNEEIESFIEDELMREELKEDG